MFKLQYGCSSWLSRVIRIIFKFNLAVFSKITPRLVLKKNSLYLKGQPPMAPQWASSELYCIIFLKNNVMFSCLVFN